MTNRDCTREFVCQTLEAVHEMKSSNYKKICKTNENNSPGNLNIIEKKSCQPKHQVMKKIVQFV